MKVYRSYSSEETKKFASNLSRKVVRELRTVNRKTALVFALEGELGSGKTTFVQGFLRGLGIKKRSPSPTFILFRRFAIRHPLFANLYHVDAYRIKTPHELLALGIKEIFSDPKNIVLVEWADRIKRILPQRAIKIRFSHSKKENERILTGPGLGVR